MDKDNEALQKLRNYTAEGKSYFDATQLLKREGYTNLQINNATYALKNGKQKVNFDVELADSLVQVANTITARNSAEKRRGKNAGISIYPGGGLPLMSVGGKLNSWWYFLPFLIILCGLLYYFSTQ